MNKKHIIIAALAFNTVALTVALSPAIAAPANMLQHIEIKSENADVIKIGKRRGARKRRGFRKGHGYFGSYNNGIATSVATTCNYYYRKAITTGSRYWWVKYNHTCLN